MVAIIGADQGGAPRYSEVGFDGVEPRRLGGRIDGMDVQPAEERHKGGMVVDIAQVVHDDEERPARIARAETAEGLAELGHPFAAAEQPAETVGVDVVKAEELLGPLGPAIGGAHRLGIAAPGPSGAPQGLEFQGTPFVEADHRRARRAVTIESPDGFFFRSNAGSCEVFQVRIRWARKPSRRRSRRTHSSVMGGRRPRCRQYSANLGTVHAEKGSPRSAGLARAMSISSRICGPVMIGSRPFGLGGSSNVVNPLSLKRWTHSYTMVTLQP